VAHKKWILLFLIIGLPAYTIGTLIDLRIELLSLVDAINSLSTAIKGAKQQEIPSVPLQPIIVIKPGPPALLNLPWLFQNNEIKQVRVLQQSLPADCGYHALKNAILLLNAFKAGSNEVLAKLYLNDLTQQKLYAAWYDKWTGSIKAKRGDGSDDWLNGGEIEYLIKLKFPENYNHSLDAITVIDNPGWLTQSNLQTGQALTQEIVKTIKDFKNQSTYQHVFILANSKEYQKLDGFIEGTWTHWITVGVNKVNNVHQFIIADSGNSDRTASPEVKALVDTLKNADIVALEIRNSPVISNLDSIGYRVQFVNGEFPEYKGDIDGAYDLTIKDAKAIIDLATKNGWMNLPVFVQYKIELHDFINQLAKKLVGDPNVFSQLTDIDKKKTELQGLLTILK